MYSLSIDLKLMPLWRVLILLPLLLLSSCVYRPLFSFGGPSHQVDIKTQVAQARAEHPELLPPPSVTAVKLPAPRLEMTPEVKRELVNMDRGQLVPASLERGADHLPIMQEILLDEGIPVELANLALIESGFNSEARSHAGAVGLWQLMAPTAKLYGLKVNLFEDQRKDPILSTLAAARHLRDLYQNYNDWNLVLAAYNAGSGTLNRAISTSGSSDYWALARTGRLNTETARFVPRFIASCLLSKDGDTRILTASAADRRNSIG
ncbi:MAG: lytic transglycosylase domain-containing protein [Oligoflexia bacterium]|nr:lytic transglycosylase domain-containing protein [Oligoflexia bacterium]